MLHLLRASAGAGKTHKLVEIYLRYILACPEQMGSVVVLSFTNKATDELRQRVIAMLHTLARGDFSVSTASLKRILGYDDATLQLSAKEALGYLLHDYDAFNIYTIDTFFQRLVRSFTYELGLGQEYTLVLGERELMHECVDLLLQAVGSDHVLEEALIALAIEQVSEGKPWQFRAMLFRWGEDLFRGLGEEGRDILEKGGDNYDIIKLLDDLIETSKVFEKEWKRRAKAILDKIKEGGFSVDDFAWGERGVIGFLRKATRPGVVNMPSERIRRASQVPRVWVKKGGTSPGVLTFVETILQPLLGSMITYFDVNYRHYKTTRTLWLLRYRLIITGLLKKIITTYIANHDRLLIQRVPLLIRTLIEGKSPLFLEHKIGKRWLHFLIDEGQDLSKDQWAGLLPFIRQGLAKGCDSWLVGDAKQAIYRWRGGNPRLLLTEIEHAIGSADTKVDVLSYNWRSRPMIVYFNNIFFAKAAELVTKKLQEEVSSGVGMADLVDEVAHISKAYAQVAQRLPEGSAMDKSGHVAVSFIVNEGSSNRWKEGAIARTIERIVWLQKRGYKAGEITLLVRNNKEATLLLDALHKEKNRNHTEKGIRYEAVAGASLTLWENSHIKLLVYGLHYIYGRDEKFSLASVVHLYQTYVARKQHAMDGLDITQEEDTLTLSADYFFMLDSLDKVSTYLPENFFKDIDTLRGLGIYAMVEALCYIFNLSPIAEEAYLNAFKEVVYKFSKRQAGTLADFLLWWDQHGKREAKVGASVRDAMQIMTIHQSKGLAFKVVIVPFCAWDLDHSVFYPPVISGHARQEPFDKLGRVPITYRSTLKDTYYMRFYGKERWQQYLEQINLLYVAFTRAQVGCYVCAPYRASKGLQTTADLLNRLLGPDGDTTLVADFPAASWEPSTMTWSLGVLPEADSVVEEAIVDSKKADHLKRDRGQSRRVLQRIGTLHSGGILWHELLSEITTLASVDKVVDDYVAKGKLSADQGIKVRHTLDTIFQDPRLQVWFSGAWEVYAERSILLSSGALWRPDRVMVRGDEAVVLDFKIGQPLDSHHKQVARYMEVVQSIGYRNVRGYLLYVSSASLIEVKSEPHLV